PPPHRLLRGHTQPVTYMQLSHSGQLLATAQGGTGGGAGAGDGGSGGGSGSGGAAAVVRLWDTTADWRCVAQLEAHPRGLSSLAFSPDDRLLCTVGGDNQRRTQVSLCCCFPANGGAARSMGGAMCILARQISDFPITRLLFSPYERLKLVSCGRENVRFWRVKRRHLPACPAILNEFARGTEFTDLAFESAYGAAVTAASAAGLAALADAVPRTVYASTKAGTLMQIRYSTRNLLCVLRLHDAGITSLSVNEAFAVTTAADGLLRLWPLDFSDFLVEARHEAPAACAVLSADGLNVAVGTTARTVGVLDVASHGYSTALRSHVGKASFVVGIAPDPDPASQEFATAGVDGTIRIWDLPSGAQRYEFASPDDAPLCLEYRPASPPLDGTAASPQATAAAPPLQHHIAVGFASGAVRVFDVPSTSTLHDYQQHGAPVLRLLYACGGRRLLSLSADGMLCLYDALKHYQPLRMVAFDRPAAAVALAASPHGDLVAVGGLEVSGAVLVYDAETMTQRRRFCRGGGGAVRPPWEAYDDSGGSGGGGVWGGGKAASEDAANEFVHLAFSSDGADLVAVTRKRVTRYALALLPPAAGGADVASSSIALPASASVATA
ncbi:unnamed protein product, partial [Phaeothamnion confervicola]